MSSVVISLDASAFVTICVMGRCECQSTNDGIGIPASLHNTYIFLDCLSVIGSEDERGNGRPMRDTVRQTLNIYVPSPDAQSSGERDRKDICDCGLVGSGL